MSKPRSFAAAAYPSLEDAENALTALEDLAREKIVKIDDAAIVQCTATGSVELHQRHGLSIGGGVVGGGAIGALAGLFLGLPVAATLAGMAVGGGLGLFDRGIDDARMKELGAALAPGQAAVCVLIREASWPDLRARAKAIGGDLIVAELTPEADAALTAAETNDAGATSPDGGR